MKYREYLERHNIGYFDKVLFIIVLAIIAIGMSYPFLAVWINILGNPLLFMIWYVVFIVVGLSLRVLHGTGCRGVVGRYSVDGIEFTVCRSDRVNAWYDHRNKVMLVSDKLYSILSSNEVRATLYHEEGHKKMRAINLVTRCIHYVWTIALITYIVVILTSSEPLSMFLFHLFVWIMPLLASTTLGAGLISWINEHEADINAVRKVSRESIASALIKVEIYDRISKYINYIPYHNIALDYIRKPSSWDIFKYLLKLSFSFPLTIIELVRKPIYLTHPPLELRLYKIFNYRDNP